MAELLLSCQDLGKAFGGAPLFEGLSFGIFEGDHIGLVGPNGSGKSTLLKILAGSEEPSTGQRSVRKRLRFGYVPQDPTFAADSTVESVLRDALAPLHLDEYEVQGRIAVVMGKADFVDATQPTSTLSGGWKKRLAIARELALEPELLLLDEPTNHLDVEGILWLEELLRQEPEAFLAVSHDRYFLESVASRMIEVNRAFAEGLLVVNGRYSTFLERKDDVLAGQASYQESLRNRVRGEVEWLSRKAKARTRKAQARIDEAGRLQSELADLDQRSKTAGVGIDFSSTERRTKRLLVAEGLTKSFGKRHIVRGLDLVLSPGQRLGLLGMNGSGKSTLLRMLAGAGAARRGHGHPGAAASCRDVRPASGPARARRCLCGGPSPPSGDAVTFEGREVHVAGWAKRFLFRTDQLETPVGRLSGGEQARVLDRAPHAGAGRPAAARRAHERSRHRHPRRARGEPDRVQRRARPRHPRPLPARSRVDASPGPRRRRRRRALRRLRAVGSETSGAERPRPSRRSKASSWSRRRPPRRSPSGSATKSSASGSRWRA